MGQSMIQITFMEVNPVFMKKDTIEKKKRVVADSETVETVRETETTEEEAALGINPDREELSAETPEVVPVKEERTAEASAVNPVKEETPAEDSLRAEAPVEDSLRVEAPVEDSLREEASVEDPVREETPVEAPMKEAALEKVSAENSEEKETPAKAPVAQGAGAEQVSSDLQKAGKGPEAGFSGGGRQPQADTIAKIGTDSRRKNSRIAFWVSLLLIVGILGGIYAYGYNYCSTHFMPGTQINGYDCGKMTEEEAEARFAEAANEYVLNIRFRGGSTEIIHAQEMGFAYKPDGSIGALLHQQDKLVWPKYFFEDTLYEIKPGGTIEDEKLMQALQSLPELQEENMEKPENAYIEFQEGNEEEDGKFVIIPETAGTTIDPVQLAAGVGDAASRYTELVDAEEIGGAYVEASLKKDDAKIIARCDDLNDLVGASITYELPDGDTMRLNSDVTKDWLVKDDDGKLVKDDEVWDEKLWEFLDKLAYNTNTIGMDRQFNSTLRGTITVSGGDYGYMVNQITEHDKLVEDFKKKTKETRKPDYYITPYNDETENDGIGDTYIEADLSAQHFWCYVDGQLMVESDFVSGDTTTGHGTPTGVFGIMFMLRDTTLRGVMQSNGKYEYETKVGYWMPFYDGCGFHDAWWRSAFGGTIYQGNGSHGCINLPVDAAQTLYSYCDEKMPVVVYW